ncbi:type II toxin-antitoxin system RatA family toxin [Magnetospira thiophila]
MPTHAEQKLLPFAPDQLFDLVADVARYPEFLPWCVGARIKRREDVVIWADLIIGFKMFRESFTSKVALDRDNLRIHVEYQQGPFKYLNNHWVFQPHPDGTMIDFFVDFEFHSKLLQKAIGVVFNEAVRRMVASFEKRAHALYD